MGAKRRLIQSWLSRTNRQAEAKSKRDCARLYEDAQRAIQVRDQFLSIASHELKTPLTALKLQTQLRARILKSGNPNAFGPERLEKMNRDEERQIERLVRLVDDMLDISRITTGKLTLRPETADLGELVCEGVERFQHFADLAAMPIELDISAGVKGHWDRHRIEQILNNLLTNALKYGGGRPVTVTVKQIGDRARLEVRDRGIGIATADQARIFEQFERAVSANQASGLGLGLYIARELVTAHHGQISVESTIGAGSTFVVELPTSAELEVKLQPGVDLSRVHLGTRRSEHFARG